MRPRAPIRPLTLGAGQVTLSPLPPPGCEPGSFGEGCSRQCDCEDGVPCDPVTGHCLCPPGLTGATCDLGESGVPLGGGRGGGSLSGASTVLTEPHLCHGVAWAPGPTRPSAGHPARSSCSGLSRPVLPSGPHLSPRIASPLGVGCRPRERPQLDGKETRQPPRRARGGGAGPGGSTHVLVALGPLALEGASLTASSPLPAGGWAGRQGSDSGPVPGAWRFPMGDLLQDREAKAPGPCSCTSPTGWPEAWGPGPRQTGVALRPVSPASCALRLQQGLLRARLCLALLLRGWG